MTSQTPSDTSSSSRGTSAAIPFVPDPLDALEYELSVLRHASDEVLEATWHVRWMKLREGISLPYQLCLGVVTDDTDLDEEGFLEADVRLEWNRNGFVRYVHGIVRQVEYRGIRSGQLYLSLEIVPALRLLEDHVHTRHFQHQTVAEILEQLLGTALVEYGRSVKMDFPRASSLRDYCVQYGESDLAFASRLMEEEGISYYFPFQSEAKHGEAPHVEQLVLVQQDRAVPNHLFADLVGHVPDRVPIISEHYDTTTSESIQRLKWTRTQQITQFETRRDNWLIDEQGKRFPSSTAKSKPKPRARVQRRHYAPDARRRPQDQKDRQDYRGPDSSEEEVPLSERRLDARRVKARRGRGDSNLSCLYPGACFDLDSNSRSGSDRGSLLVTHVEHEGECPDVELGAPSEGVRYRNTFTCIPKDTPFYPLEATPKPRAQGPQTATVTGPAGEEIHTDQYGRIQVHFHWDQDFDGREASSCWIRVAQLSSGQRWGGIFLPRIGMEVLVEFLDGNPDRPVVTGCLFNGRSRAPYALPEHKTRSTIKSNSTVGGEGFNELRFEDAKGKEEIFTHAQRDQNEEVRRNRSRLVDGNERITIEGNQSLRINGHPVHEDDPDLRQGRETQIDGDDFLETTSTVHVTAPRSIALEVGDSSIVIEPKCITLTTGDGAYIRLDKDVLACSRDSSSLELSKGIAAYTDTSMKLDAGDMAMRGKSEIVAKGGLIRLN